MNLDDVKRAFKYYDPISRNGFVTVFNIDHCEICEMELEAPNSVGVAVHPSMLARLGLRARKLPDDGGGWSELHGKATCTACCYDPDAYKHLPSTL